MSSDDDDDDDDDDDSPVKLVRQPECSITLPEILETEDESPAGDVQLFIEFATCFTCDHPFFSRLIINRYRHSLGELTEDAVVGMLSSGHVPRTIIDTDLAFLANEIVASGRRMASQRGSTALGMNVDVGLYFDRIPAYLDNDDYFFHSEDDEAGDVDDGDDEYEFVIGFVPASEESIEGLEKLRISDDDERKLGLMACTVCLEDIRAGSEATRLPCQHRFHGDCIVEWLKTSKFCPVCRFEMPS